MDQHSFRRCYYFTITHEHERRNDLPKAAWATLSKNSQWTNQSRKDERRKNLFYRCHEPDHNERCRRHYDAHLILLNDKHHLQQKLPFVRCIWCSSSCRRKSGFLLWSSRFWSTYIWSTCLSSSSRKTNWPACQRPLSYKRNCRRHLNLLSYKQNDNQNCAADETMMYASSVSFQSKV